MTPIREGPWQGWQPWRVKLGRVQRSSGGGLTHKVNDLGTEVGEPIPEGFSHELGGGSFIEMGNWGRVRLGDGAG